MRRSRAPGIVAAIAAIGILAGTAYAAGKVFFTLTNTNPYAITFDSLTAASVSGVSGGIGGSPACATSDVTLTTLPITGLSLPVGANTTSATQSISGVVSMIGAAPDACQGAVFNVSLTLIGWQT
jgi:hypothetical protein